MLVIVDDSILSNTVIRTLRAKEMIEDGLTAVEACSIVGISRSSFYLYKDKIWNCDIVEEEQGGIE